MHVVRPLGMIPLSLFVCQPLAEGSVSQLPADSAVNTAGSGKNVALTQPGQAEYGNPSLRLWGLQLSQGALSSPHELRAVCSSSVGKAPPKAEHPRLRALLQLLQQWHKAEAQPKVCNAGATLTFL